MAADLDRSQSGNQHPHLITLSSLDPHQPKGPAKKPVTLGYPPQPHPLTLLKNLKKRW